MAKDSFHPTNLLLLLTETFKSTTGMSPELMNYIFHFVERPDDLRFSHTLRKRDSVYHCTESLETWKAVHCLHSHTLYTFLERKMLGEHSWNSFKSFHRFCTYGFVILFIGYFYIMSLTSNLFSCIFFEISQLVFFLTISNSWFYLFTFRDFNRL